MPRYDHPQEAVPPQEAACRSESHGVHPRQPGSHARHGFGQRGFDLSGPALQQEEAVPRAHRQRRPWRFLQGLVDHGRCEIRIHGATGAQAPRPGLPDPRRRTGGAPLQHALPALHGPPAGRNAPDIERHRLSVSALRSDHRALPEIVVGWDIRPRAFPERGDLGLQNRRGQQEALRAQARYAVFLLQKRRVSIQFPPRAKRFREAFFHDGER